MRKSLLPMLLIIIVGIALITPMGSTININHDLTDNIDRPYTFDVEHKNHRSTYTLYVSVPPSLNDYYGSKSHQLQGDRDYANFVTPDAVKTIAEDIRKIIHNTLYGDEEFANGVLALVHQIPYSVSASKYPVETLADNSGDCDVLSYLAASIIKAGGLDVILLVYRDLPGSHMNIGVHLPIKPLSVSGIDPVGVEYNNKTYWVAECTPGNWKVGQQPEIFDYVEPVTISLQNPEEPAPGPVSSSINSPLSPSSISITLSLENSSAAAKERSLRISGSISPACSGKRVVMYISRDIPYREVFQTYTDDLGGYSFTWNLTSAGKFYIKTSVIPFSGYSGSDSDLMTFFAGSYPDWIELDKSTNSLAPDNVGYKSSSSKTAGEFLRSNVVGANVSLSGEFMILKNNQTMMDSRQTVTIPEKVRTILLPRRQRTTITMPEQIVTVQESDQDRNQFGFIFQNNNGNYSANVRVLSDSDLTETNKQNSKNNSVFVNASSNIEENSWYNVVVKVSMDEMTGKLLGENGTLLEDFAVKVEATDSGECGVLISCTPDTFIAFKKLKVENLDQPTDKSEANTQLSERGSESLAPYVLLLSLLGIIGAVIAYLRKEKQKGQKKTRFNQKA
jgi:hypothetical protein